LGKLDLNGRRAVVTGSTSGIGAAVAAALAQAGCSVMLNGFGDSSDIEQARAALAISTGRDIRFHDADMRDPAAIGGLIDAAEAAFGGVDILVNNAGIQHVSPIELFPIQQWNDILAVNLSAAFHGIRRALPGMRDRGWGRIVNTASIHGLVASVDKAAYIAAKHGLVGLTKVVALEAAGSGVTCNAICPGSTHTPLVQTQIELYADQQGLDLETAARERLAAKQPSQAFVKTEDIGALAVFLCSDAAQQITGAALPIDGGWTAQ
jgi:3-hydroxybutyrate dehydrogenase